MNLPIARGLRGLIYVLWDLSQVDPSDLSMLFAGAGRLRIGFAEINPPEGGEPNDDMVEHAARRCCANPYFAFDKPAGTSLICIQGDWSNVVDAKIKGRLTTAMAADPQSPYAPLYARAVGTPKPWGVTALFAEYTGAHQPLAVDWSLERGVRTNGGSYRPVIEPIATEPSPVVVAERPPLVVAEPTPAVVTEPTPVVAAPSPVLLSEPAPAMAAAPSPPAVVTSSRECPFATFWEFAIAVNRSDPAALALAGNGAHSKLPIDGVELRKLLDMMWFRTVLGRLSRDWRERLLEALIDGTAIPDYAMKLGRQTVRLRELSYEQLQTIGSKTMVADWIRPDLDLLITVGRFWGPEALTRFRFVEAPERHEPSRMETLLQRLRG
jgi:hypothetical protein